MTGIERIPDLNFITFTGTVRWMQDLQGSKYGVFVIKFNVENTATSPGGGSPPRTNMLSVEAWGSLAEEIDRNISEGTPVLVEGSLVSRSYEDKSKGLHYRLTVKASRVENLGVMR